MVGRAAKGCLARNVERFQGKAADVGRAVGLDVRAAVGQAHQGPMGSGLGEQSVPGMVGQVGEYFQGAGGRQKLLAMERSPLAELRRPGALEASHDLGDALEKCGFIGRDALAPGRARLFHE